MQTIKSEISVSVNEKSHTYLCNANCTLNECFEALTHLRCYISGRIQEENEKIELRKSQETDKPVTDVIKEVLDDSRTV